MRVLLVGRANLLHTNQQDVLESIVSLMEKAGHELVYIKDEVVCMEASINLGIADVAEELFKEFKEKAEALNPDVIVSAYAAGVAKWNLEVPEKFGIKLKVPYLHLSRFFAEELKKLKPSFKPFPYKYFLQHGCTLARKLGEYEVAREIFSFIPEIQVVEESYPTAELEGLDPAVFNSCPASWLNFAQPELGEYAKENYITDVVLPAEPDYVGSTCANGHFGIRQGLEIAEIEEIKPLYFTQIIDQVWR